MNILMISSEAEPFAKTGGLADVVTSLSKSLANNRHDVKIFLPYYSNTKDFFTQYQESEYVDIISGVTSYKCNFLTSKDSNFVFLQNKELFGRDEVYGSNNTPYIDNEIRFSVFAKAALEYCKLIKWMPDIIHSHDWPAGLTAAYLKEEKKYFKNTKSVFTIHNLGYQGIFSRHSVHYTNLPLSAFTNDKYLKEQRINFLKSAVLNSDFVTTVSKGYTQETQTKEYGFGMEKILRGIKDTYVGIQNGIDYQVWDSKKDKYLFKNYDYESLEGKYEHKEKFCEKYKLDPKLPLFTMISRLSYQKGIDELYGSENIMEELLSSMNINVVVVGTGEVWAEEKLKKLEKNYPNFKAFIEFDEKLAHRVEAAGDFFLMPSKYEPCGLNQMYSLRYGNIPIVSNTGGLSDTVKTIEQDPVNFNGFIFDKIDKENINLSITKAINLWYNNKELLKKYIKNGMEQDLSWTNSCKQYEEIYKKI